MLYLPKGEYTTFCKTNNSVNYKRFAFPSHHSHSPAWVHRKNVTVREEKVVCVLFVVLFFSLGGGWGHGDFETPLPTILLNQFYEPTIKGKYIFLKRKGKETLTCLDGCNGEHDFSSAINVCVQYTQDVLKLLRNYETLEQNTYTKISETRP